MQPFIDDLKAKFAQHGPHKIEVSLDGQLAFDPAHFPDTPSAPNALEIHPVTRARIVRVLP